MRVVVSGVSGLIGSALHARLKAEGHDVVALSRRPIPPLETIVWDLTNGRFDAGGLDGADYVIHLAGEPVAQRWNEATRRAIRTSRVEATRLLVEGLKSLQNKPKALISASAVGFYGSSGDERLDESSPPGSGFLPDTCIQWEKAALDAMGLGIRTVVLRIGIVLSTRAGALAKMLLPFKLGLGGPAGSGDQWMPWIHIDDIVGALFFAMENEGLMDVVNGTAPSPVTNREFSKALGRALSRPAFLPAPAAALRLALGDMAEIVLEGQRAVPRKLTEAGYQFRYPELDGALADVLRERK